MSDKNIGMNLDALKKKLDTVEHIKLPITDRELCDRYEKLYTGAVNDVMREMTLMDQALPHNITPLKMEMTCAGIAYTIRSNPDPTVDGEMEIRARMLDDMPKGCMVIWDAGDETEAIQAQEARDTRRTLRADPPASACLRDEERSLRCHRTLVAGAMS